MTSPLRPLDPEAAPAGLGRWHELVDDLVATLDHHRVRDAVGVGHSLGAVVTAFAAARRPDLFRSLVLLDPVLFAGRRAILWGWMKRLGLAGQLPLVRAAHRRRDRFGSLDEARRRWGRKGLFRRFDPRCFDDYVTAALVETAGGEAVVLRYPKAWEERIFRLTPHDPWPAMRSLACPVTVIAGAESDTFLVSAARRLRRELPQARVEWLEGHGHFVPMEAPDEVADRILRAAGLTPTA